MAMTLPTDTRHLTLETRQYELFNLPLGQGIRRSTIAAALAVCAVWWLVLLVLGASPISRLGPTLYVVPPFVAVYFGTRVGDDGRMTVLRWYDAVLARVPARRHVVRNPLLPMDANRQAPLVLHVTTELRPGARSDAATPRGGTGS